MLLVANGGIFDYLRRSGTEIGAAKSHDTSAHPDRDGCFSSGPACALLVHRLADQPLNPTIIDVNRLINGLGEFLRRTLSEDISFEVVGSGGLWPVEANPAELEAAILNLAVNARDAMEKGGRLTIETSNAYLDEAYCQQHDEIQAGQYALIAVTDTGPGMKREILDRAFEPFFTTKPTGQGTGLGLSQVYGFAKQSGGHVKIYSEPGEGTTVQLYLRRFVGMPVEAAKVTNALADGSHPGECVLV
jgi:signal transduction histidine kinase